MTLIEESTAPERSFLSSEENTTLETGASGFLMVATGYDLLSQTSSNFQSLIDLSIDAVAKRSVCNWKSKS